MQVCLCQVGGQDAAMLPGPALPPEHSCAAAAGELVPLAGCHLTGHTIETRFMSV